MAAPAREKAPARGNAPAAGENEWTTPPDVRRTLRRRWDNGSFLAMFAEGQRWAPLGVGVRGPAAWELASRFTDVQAWVGEWERADQRAVRVEHKRVGGRAIGSNTIPCRAWIDGYQQLWQYLGVGQQVLRFHRRAGKGECGRPAARRLDAGPPHEGPGPGGGLGQDRRNG